MGPKPSSLENYFAPFRKNVIGANQTFQTPYGRKKIIYADWTASGRLYKPLEDKIAEDFGPFVGNTHTETTVTGTTMTRAYHEAKEIIKKHVGAGPNDVLISIGSGMTGAVLKLQRILGFKIPENLKNFCKIPEDLRPVVFVTHMEHHSNQTSWLETIADVVVISPDEMGLVDSRHLESLLRNYQHRKIKIAAVSACSNVTGIQTPYHQIARIMHEHHGLCFVDFAASAPYVEINMHPRNKLEKLDAIYFSPHKFLGGPGATGILVFDSKLYRSRVPDHPGGGTVTWTNPWGGREYHDDIEAREDGGTPPFLQTIRAALAIKLKEKIGVEKLIRREEEIVSQVFPELEKVKSLHILAGNIKRRLAIFSFSVDNLHYNLAVKLLNDRFGVQTRGGCACAGTYGHYLFKINREISKKITDRIDQGDLSTKPGFIRLSIHPIMSSSDISYTLKAIQEVVRNFRVWGKDYSYNRHSNEFSHSREKKLSLKINQFFDF